MASGTSVDNPVNFKQDSNRHKGQMKFQVPKIYSDTPLSRNNNHKNGNNLQRINRKNSKECGGSHKRRYTYSGNPQEYKNSFKRRRRSGIIVPPTKFLLGGNINDPLNLSSLEDEEINRKMNEVTPYSSPVPPPPRHHNQIEVLIPQNINDPLNLNSGEEIEFKIISPKNKKKKKNKPKKRNSGEKTELNPVAIQVEKFEGEEKAVRPSSLEGIVPETESVERKEALPSHKELSKESAMPVKHHVRTCHDRSIDKIVSPVVPQGSPMKFRRNRSWSFSNAEDRKKRDLSESGGSIGGKAYPKKLGKLKQTVPAPTFRKKDERFQHGNYDRYYGYRNGPHQFDDPRLKTLKKDWFKDKDVLDIGCNVGHLTLSIARDFDPKKMIGLDIDDKLIKVARKNVRHYLKTNVGGKKEEFPISLALCHGPIATSVLPKKLEDCVEFPNNVFFVQGNYVPESEEFLEMQRPEFDTILCLSLTKWIHLNNGDDGLKRVFKRIFSQLRPGGRLILEAQPWKSYVKKKTLTETIYNNFNAIKLKPDQFNEYLLSSEVGFSTCELIDSPKNPSKGFCRPMYVFTKSSIVKGHEEQERMDSVEYVYDTVESIVDSEERSA